MVTQNWLLDEDEALKAKLAGLAVYNRSRTKSQPVRVRFVDPESEAGNLTYPIVLIELVGIRRAPEREHRGFWYEEFATPSMAPPPATPQTGSVFPPATPPDPISVTMWAYHNFPIPYWLTYQVTAMTRSAIQDRQLQAALRAPDRLPERFGFLQVPFDGSGTIRALEVVSVQNADLLTPDAAGQGSKRIFRKIHTIDVSSELDYSTVTQVANVLSIDINLLVKTSEQILAHNVSH